MGANADLADFRDTRRPTDDCWPRKYSKVYYRSAFSGELIARRRKAQRHRRRLDEIVNGTLGGQL